MSNKIPGLSRFSRTHMNPNRTLVNVRKLTKYLKSHVGKHKLHKKHNLFGYTVKNEENKIQSIFHVIGVVKQNNH